MCQLISSQLFTKILRAADAQGKEAYHLSEAETKEGKGSSQVMNLITVDCDRFGALATKIWNISNALIACKHTCNMMI